MNEKYGMHREFEKDIIAVCLADMILISNGKEKCIQPNREHFIPIKNFVFIIL